MDGHRACSCLFMVLSKERIVCRSEESLSAACGYTSQEYQHDDSGCKSCEHRGYAPEEDCYRHNPFAAETVSGPSSERNHHGVAKIKDCRDQTNRGVRQIKSIADSRQYCVEHLPVSLVEKVCHPEEQQNFPFVPASFCCFCIHCQQFVL